MSRVPAILLLATASLAACGRSALPGSVGDGGVAGTGGAGLDGGAGGVGAGGHAAGGGDAAAGTGGDAATGAGGAGTGGLDGGAGLGGGSDGGPGGTAAALTRIEIAPPATTLAVGTGLVFKVTADYADGSSNDVTAQSVLTSSAPTVVSVSGQTVSALAPGMATIAAAFMGRQASATVTVTAATLQSITIDPPTPTLALGTTVGLVATGVFSDGSKQDVSAIATWTTSDPTIATVTVGPSGVTLEGVKAGATLVTAALLKLEGAANVTVTNAVVQSLDVTPAHPTIPIGIQTQFQATATYSDTTTQDVSTQVTWTVSDPTIATIDASGNLLTKAMGSVDVTATFGAVSAKTTVIVMGTTLVSLQVTPATTTVPAGVPQAYAAIGTYSDGSKVDVTTSVAWSTDGAAASVSNATGQEGVATGISAGTVHVQAKLGTITGSASLTITSAIVTSLVVAPKTATLPVGFTQVLTATATYSDATKLDVTALAVWSSSDTTVASVSNAASGGVASGTVTSVKIGAATITAAFGGSTDTAQVTTTAAVITEIDVAPTTATVVAGRQQAFVATAKISDGSTSDVTTQVTWASSATNVATISNAAASKGLATSLAKGTTTISATLSGKKGTAELDVSGPVLQALQVTPFLVNLEVGASQAVTATAVYSDGSTQNVTANATWSVTDTTVATVGAATGMGMGMGMAPARENVTGAGAGSATVQAMYGGLSASALVTVTAPVVLVKIVVTPTTASVRVGQTQAFVAQAVFSDGSTMNVTTASAWTSSSTTIATVTTPNTGRPGGGPGGGPGGAGGTATGVAAGTTSITATYMTLTASAELTVTAPTLVSVEVSPPSASLVIGQTQQFQATALYDDGSRQTVTTTALWASSATDVLAVSDAAAGGGPGGGGGTPKGDAVALTAGKANVTATYMGLTGTSSVTVTAPTLVSVQVTPTNPTIGKGASQQFQAVAVYSDFSTVNVTNTASWVSDTPTVATISNGAAGPGGAGGRGRATGVGTGTATITATYSGVSGSTKLTVIEPQVSSLVIAPANATLPVGIGQRFTATAMFTDGSSVDVTATATWTSSDSTIVSISNAMGAQGVATSLASGSVTITATYMGSMGTTTMTVSTASLVGIVIGGIPATLAVGGHAQLTATASYDDGSTVDVTKLVTWISTVPDAATVSNATGSNGLATGVSAGMTSIEAHFEGMVGTDPLTVGP